MREYLVVLQAVTFVLLGALLLLDGHWRLGVAQLLLAAITALIYL